MYLIIYGIVILLIYILECVTHQKLKNFLPIITIIYLVVLMGGNISNPDTIIYYNIYNSSEFFSKDFGFGLLVRVCKNGLGMNIDMFRMTIAIIGFLLMANTVNQFVKNTMSYYLLYFLYPFMMDVVQMRNFLVMCILMFSIRYLLDRSKKGIVKYVMFVLIAATIQKTALIYLPLVFIHKIDRKKLTRGLIAILATLSMLVGLSNGMVTQIGNILLSTVADSLSGSSGFLTRNTNYGWIILWGTQICNFALVYWSQKLINRSENYCVYRPNKLKCSYEFTCAFVDIVFWINIYMFCFCPLYVLNVNFYRIMRNIMPLNLVVYCIVLYLRKGWQSKSIRISYEIAIWCYAVIMFYINFFYNGDGGYIESIIKPIFEKNWLIGY